MDTEESKGGGKRRVRTKGLQKKLLQQVEFYFGDSNLQKDRFLQQKMKEHPDGYVSVETIASFNKMKSITSDIKMVVQAMKNSSLLELTDDEKWVRRSTPLPTATDTDERTIYVEHLTPNCDQGSVRKLLKVFGNITYVSLPRHKVSGAIKGFSFVEFATVKEANAALKYFSSGTKPATSSTTQNTQPSKPSGVSSKNRVGDQSLGEGQTMETAMEKVEDVGCGVGGVGAKGGEGGSVEEQDGETKEAEETDRVATVEGDRNQGVGDETKNNSDEKTQEVGNRKRKRDTGAADEGGEVEEVPVPLSKKSKTDDSSVHKEEKEETAKEDEEEAKKEMEQKETSKEKECGEGTMSAGQLTTEHTKCSSQPAQSRKRKRSDEEREGGREGGNRERRLERLDSQTTEDTVGEENAEGKRGRKRNRQHKKWDWEAAIKNLQLRVMPKKEWLEMRGIFRDMQKGRVREMKQKLNEGGESEKREGGGYVGKCLVKVQGVGEGEGEDQVTMEKLKEICSKYGTVAYIDIKDGESEGYVRYAKSGCVDGVVNEHLTHVKFSAVSDEDERAYYLKTVAARKQTRWGKKKKNIRGQDKIISRALQHRGHTKTEKARSPVQATMHIRFSDDSEHES